MMQQKKTWSAVWILLAGSMWGCMGILVRNLQEINLNSMEIVAVRTFITAICMTIGVAVCKRQAFKIHSKDIWCFIGTGIVSVVFFNYCYFKTMTITSLGVAAVLLYTAPAFVMLLSLFLFKEKFNRYKAGALLLTFVGCILVTGAFREELIMSMEGVLIGLGAGLGYAMYSIFGRYALDRGYDSVTITLYTFLFASVGVLPFIDTAHIAASLGGHREVWAGTVFWTIITTVAAYLFYTGGLKGMEAGRASVIASVEPVVAACIGVLLYQEKIEWSAAAGILLIIGAVALVQMQDKTREKNREKQENCNV